jgi:hypothetical protein
MADSVKPSSKPVATVQKALSDGANLSVPQRPSRITNPVRYVLDPLAPFPKRWRDHHGPIRVMMGPCEGWVIGRRPGCIPFLLTVSDLCNATRRPIHGPFEVVGAKTKPVALANPSPKAETP